MEVIDGGRRVMISHGGAVSAMLEGDTVHTASAAVAGAVSVGAVSDVVAFLTDLQAATPVATGVVSASNVRAGELSADAFDPAGEPLPVASGGLGVREVEPLAAVIGGPAGEGGVAASWSNVGYSEEGAGVRAAGAVQLGMGFRLEGAKDPAGWDVLMLRGAPEGSRAAAGVALSRPSLTFTPRVALVTVGPAAAGTGAAEVEVLCDSGFPRTVHAVAVPAGSAAPPAAKVVRGRGAGSGSAKMQDFSTGKAIVPGLISGQTYDFYTAVRDARGNVSTATEPAVGMAG